MCKTKRTAMMSLVALAITGGLWAEHHVGGMNPMAGMPSFGLQNPTIGSGSEYLITTKGKQMDMSVIAMGKENVEGETGYWMEMRMNSPELGGEMVTKTLTVASGTQAGMKRMIMQAPGKPPMEMGGFMMNMMQQHQSAPITPNAGGANTGMGELIGTESMTVPAGTFDCKHYRKTDARGTTDLWISTDVTPYAMVKMTSPDSTMVLKKVLTNETTHINGEPQKMQMPQMPKF
jgi:hypothetical protein